MRIALVLQERYNKKEKRQNAHKAKGCMKSKEEQQTVNGGTILCLLLLWPVLTLGLTTLQAFNFDIDTVAQSLHGVEDAALITAFPSLAIGVATFVYCSLADFISLRRIYWIGIFLLVIGSLGGYCILSPVAVELGLNNVWGVIIFRCIQTFGTHCSASVYLALCGKKLPSKIRVVFLGLYTAGTQVAIIFGVLAGGFLLSFGWEILFLLPLFGLFFAPLILWKLPKEQKEAKHIDWIGLALFSLFAMFLTYYCMTWDILFLLLTSAFCLFFGLYVTKAKDPFITPSFFKNISWLIGGVSLLLFWFPSLVITPILHGLGDALWDIPASTISLCIVPPVCVGVVTGICAGSIIRRLGDARTVMLAGALEVISFILASIAIPSDFIFVCLSLSFYFAGAAIVFSPLVDIIVSSLPASQGGRGSGLVGFFTQLGASLGSAVLDPLIVLAPSAFLPIFSREGTLAQYTWIFLFCGVVVLFNVGLFCFMKKRIVRVRN